jgi:uncharacterized membrane protein YgaE (UPF0421/DUF939 family)
MAAVAPAIVSRLRDAFGRRWRMATDDIGPILQSTAAATIAWLIAARVVDHREPFFAPIAALVALNTSLGERGLNALRLLQGVVLGICVGELCLLVLGGDVVSLPLAVGTLLALLLARAVGGSRIVYAQAGISAILTISVANGEVGPQRLIDALIGAGVALVFSQFLFSPQPLRLLREVETDVLAAMAAALELVAEALDGDESRAERAVTDQRALRDRLSELARMRRASRRVARHSLVWRSQIAPVVREDEDAGHLDLLGSSALMLTRTSLETRDEDQRLLAPHVRAFAETLADLARQPGDRDTRQRAADRSLEVLQEMRAACSDPDPELQLALNAAHMGVVDLMLFLGVDPDDARLATHEEVRDPPDLEVRPPAPAPSPGLAQPRAWRWPRRGR